MANLVAVVCFICGIVAAVPVNERIIGGKDAPEGAFPYVASLRGADNIFLGAGAILSDSWILTVAQTIRGDNVKTVVVGTTKQSGNGTTYKVSKTVVNPNYDTYDLHDDIALIQIDGKMILGPNVKPVELPDAAPANGTAVTVAGWGNTDLNNPVRPDNMQYINVTIIDNERCRSGTNTSICTIGPGKGTCFGDNGDPVVADNVVYGMSAWMVPPPCAKGKLFGHTNVALFTDWIREVTGM